MLAVGPQRCQSTICLQQMRHNGARELIYRHNSVRIFCTSSEKWSENRSSRFERKILLISFSRGSGPHFNYKDEKNFFSHRSSLLSFTTARLKSHQCSKKFQTHVFTTVFVNENNSLINTFNLVYNFLVTRRFPGSSLN